MEGQVPAFDSSKQSWATLGVPLSHGVFSCIFAVLFREGKPAISTHPFPPSPGGGMAGGRYGEATHGLLVLQRLATS